jgi:hypothetical protein
MFRRMGHDKPDEKWNRLQRQVQEGIANAYLNPERHGCPERKALTELARRAADFDDSIEEDAQWQHVTHCSPCYREYLEEFKNCRQRKPPRRAG